MHKEIREQNIRRIAPFLDKIESGILLDRVDFEIKYRPSKEPIPFGERLNGDFATGRIGELWGDTWDSAWFHLKGTIPQAWSGAAVAADIDLNGEALVFDDSGCPVYGLSGGSAFLEGYRKPIYMLSEACAGGEEIELWVEAAANNIMGVNRPPIGKDSSDRTPYQGVIRCLRLVRYDLEMWHLWLDLSVLASMLKVLPDAPRRNRMVRVVNEVIDMRLGRGASASACREHLRQLWTPANASDLTVTGVGHAHIDTGWLWPVMESVRKCARTFASQIALIEKYPDYVFGASQPQHYQFVKDRYPALYEKIKKAVKEGRWELQGGMWVEADCNVISGESMVRQLIHGKNFFRDEFGEEVTNLWLPDVFGYSAAMPQILKKSGIDFFMTQKISWNQFNTFPFHLFNWRGVDGTEIVTHFLPENTYNSRVHADKLIEAQRRFNENDRCAEFVSLYGMGDGGGGPKEEHVELGLRMRNLEGCPKWRPGKAGEAFERMKALSADLASWSGELYLELHRGTLTTQALVKLKNRQLENQLRSLEFLYACLPVADYPGAELDAIWKLILINQFHDIIPGSSIQLVYEQTHKEYAECEVRCNRLLEKATSQLFEADGNTLTFVNLLSYDYTRPVTLPADWRGCAVVDSAGQAVAVQPSDDGIHARIPIPALGSVSVFKGDKNPDAVAADSDGLVLENDLVRYAFDPDGRLVRAFDKEADRDLLRGPGNMLSLYEDNPLNWDAWDIDAYYENLEMEQARMARPALATCGPVRDVLVFDLKIGRSTIRQKAILRKDSKALDFETTVDWKEQHRMLRVAFPTTIQTNESSCDIQYSFVKRPNHRNTSWDRARFEVAAHTYADLSDNGYGIALLNDCKYGYKILENTIDLNLLRSPTYPDATADQREHRFVYSFLPHTGPLVESNVMAEAQMLNRPPVRAHGRLKVGVEWPCSLSGKGVALEVVKKAEKEACIVVRLVETDGRHSRAVLKTAPRFHQLVPTNLMEWVDDAPIDCSGPVAMTLKPFEIATFKLRELTC